MSRNKVNRFTFDAHSVVLFSALVLAGPAAASSASSQRLPSGNTLVSKVNPSSGPRMAGHTLVAHTPPPSSARQQASRNHDAG